MDRETVIRDLEYLVSFGGASQQSMVMQIATEALILLKEQEVTEQISDAIHETAKQFRQTIVRCKDCKYWDAGHTEECDNSNSICFHNGWCKPNWFCADGDRR